MGEIKIVISEIEQAFNELRDNLEALESTSTQISFSISNLDITNMMNKIETEYYEILNEYKTVLEQVESEMRTKLIEFVQKEEDLASKMK